MDFTYRYSLDVANNTIFPLSKMIEKLERKSRVYKQEKDVFNRFDEEMLQGGLLVLPCILVQSQWRLWKQGETIYLKAIRKDLELIF